MAAELPDQLKGVLDGANFAHLATVNPDGSPHVTAMWVERAGDRIAFNTAEGRRKLANVRRHPLVSISIFDSDHPYQPFTIQGRVVDVTRAAADEMIDRLAGKYLGVDEYPYRSPCEIRVALIVEPLEVVGPS